MFDSLRFTAILKLNIFSTLTFASIILVLLFANTILSNSPLGSDVSINGRTSQRLSTHTHFQFHLAARGSNLTTPAIKTPALALFETSELGKRFDSRIDEFLTSKKCRVQFFMTWIWPAYSFGEKEVLGLDSLFQTNPRSCAIILSSTMDSEKGLRILKPLTDQDFSVLPITPDLSSLFRNTPAEIWFDDIRTKKKDPGGVPLAQNLSNLIRLSVLYKYGGVYLDADFIILKDFSGLRNSIGAQSVDPNGNWTRLNNAVLIFDRAHPLLYKFMEEFAFSFDGNRWGHNGPYLVSRVVDRVANTGEINFTILPPMAFYPVDWTRVGGFLTRPQDRMGRRWVEAKIRQLRGSSYAVHLWNRESGKFRIEEGSIISGLLSDGCVICRRYTSTSLQRD